MRYEIAVSVHTGNELWAHGSWPAGVSDVNIFRAGLKQQLEYADEFAVADDGHSDIRCVLPPGLGHPLHYKLSLIRARQENFNGRLKIFNVLTHTFRHKREKHLLCFSAVLNVTEVMVDLEPMSEVDL